MAWTMMIQETILRNKPAYVRDSGVLTVIGIKYISYGRRKQMTTVCAILVSVLLNILRRSGYAWADGWIFFEFSALLELG